MIPGIVAGQMRQGGGGGGDPYWANVLALINGTAAEGIVDAKGRPLTRNGSHSIVTTDPDFPEGAIYFDGSPANNIRYTSPIAWMELPGDFTIEVDYKPLGRTSGYPSVIGGYTEYGANGGFCLFDRHASANTQLTFTHDGAFTALQNPAAVVQGVKYVIQINRSGSTMRMFVNGQLVSSATRSSVVRAHNNYMAIGANGDSGDTYINGLVGRFRVTDGVARNTSNYTPDSDPWPAS